jgi:hypothetical protein
MSDDHGHCYAVPPGSVIEYRYTVYFENLALWKEQDPVRRATIARQLAEWTSTLAALEEEEARQLQAQTEAA